MAKPATIEGRTETVKIQRGFGVQAGGVTVVRVGSDSFSVTVPSGVKIVPLDRDDVPAVELQSAPQ